MSDVHVRMRIGEEQYALPVETVTEVVELGAMTPVPGSDTRILGLSNLHGEVIAVIDLAAMIGIDTNTERERVVVAEQGSRRCGFAVDHVVDVGSLAERTPEHQLPYITATALVEDSLVGVLDARALLEALREVGGQ